jgi:hypothetical protein
VSNLYPWSKVLWSLAASGLGTTISGSGNSGGWKGTGPGDILPQADFETAVDLRDVLDVALMVSVGAITGSPSLTVLLNAFDDAGNLYATAITTEAITAAGQSLVSGGLHGPSGSELVLSGWGQVAWTQTGAGASCTGVEITLLGR